MNALASGAFDPFLATLRQHGDWFDRAAPLTLARAPGRLDVMGGIADYSGSLVLQLPLAQAAFAAAQWSAPPVARVRTIGAHGGSASEVSVSIVDLLRDYAVVRARFAADPATRWAAYVLGAITVLHHQRGVAFDRGVTWLLASAVPPGKGVSSSAAIEIASMKALLGLLDPGVVTNGRDLALLCQMVENLVVGAPCGVMDQMTAACGEANTLLALLCQPAELQDPVPLPDEIELYGIDSGIRHAVTGADYGSVRVGAFMGYRIITSLASDDDSRWRGCLANVSPAEWERDFRDLVPERLRGDEFLHKYGTYSDPVTSVDPARTYAVRQPTAHPIYEHERVRQYRELLLSTPIAEDTLVALGELMYGSHASYSACGLGSNGTDTLVEMVRREGPPRGLYGAKITGGGSGGTVAVLARRGSRAAIDAIAARYTRETGRPAAVIAGSSDGADRCGTTILNGL